MCACSEGGVGAYASSMGLATTSARVGREMISGSCTFSTAFACPLGASTVATACTCQQDIFFFFFVCADKINQ